MPGLRNGVTELRASVDEFMLAMYASEMMNLLFTRSLLCEAPRANAWSLALGRAAIRTSLPRLLELLDSSWDSFDVFEQAGE